MGKWIDQAKFPDLFAHVKIFTPNFPKGIEFVSAHIPNGSGYGWIKVEHFRILSKALIESPDSPRILTGDFNEIFSSGQIVSFRSKIKENGGIKEEYTKEQKAEWGRSVRDVLSHHAHGMKNVYERMHPTPVTHLVKGGGVCFDHGFASRLIFHHKWRKTGLSDHSALWFEIRRRINWAQKIALQNLFI